MAEKLASDGEGKSEEQQCPYCKSMIPAAAVKCRYCAEWVTQSRGPAQPPSQARPATAAPAAGPGATQPSTAPLRLGMGSSPLPPLHTAPERGSVMFAAITFVMYLIAVTSPIAAIMNVIGLITGPRRGCFVAMIVLFWVIPIVLIVVLIATGTSIGVPVLDEWLNEAREAVGR